MSEFVYPNTHDTCTYTPHKSKNEEPTIRQVYLTSLKKEGRGAQMCLLCLQNSSDCDSRRCHDPKHMVCSECACEWEIDKVCPVCKICSVTTSKKSASFQSKIMNISYRDNSEMQTLPQVVFSQSQSQSERSYHSKSSSAANHNAN